MKVSALYDSLVEFRFRDTIPRSPMPATVNRQPSTQHGRRWSRWFPSGCGPAALWWVCLSLVPGLQAQGRVLEPGQETAVRELVARYAAARGSADANAIGALFTGDADQLVSSGEWRKGWDALVRGMLESSRQSSGARTIAVETVRAVAADVALADARYEIAGTGGAADRRMWSTFVVVRTAEGWRIAAIRNMLPAR